MPQPDRESVCGRRIVDAYQVNRGLQVIHGQVIHQGMTRISTAGQWVHASKPSPPSITKVCLVRNVFVVAHRYAWATSATVLVRSRDMILCEWLLWSKIFNVRYFRFC